MTCGILELPDCIVQRFTDFLLSIINAPLQPFLNAIRDILTQPANIQAFYALWTVIVYVISAFYGLFILASGLNFVVSGHSPERREQAKEWLQNAILMIFFVQASFLLYTLLADVAASLAVGGFNLINPNFFLITLDNPVNIGLELVLGMAYLATIFITLLVLSINYLIGSIGIIFFPIGIFLYFIPPLRDAGKLIISKILFVLFLPFFATLVLAGASRLTTIGIFANMKIVLAVAAFGIVDVMLVVLAILAIFRAVMSVLNSSITRAILFLKTGIATASRPPNPPPTSQYARRTYYERYGRK